MSGIGKGNVVSICKDSSHLVNTFLGVASSEVSVTDSVSFPVLRVIVLILV